MPEYTLVASTGGVRFMWRRNYILKQNKSTFRGNEKEKLLLLWFACSDWFVSTLCN
jgi:hypothetical protein